MDHLECGLTGKLVCQSVLYSSCKVPKLDFSAKKLLIGKGCFSDDPMQRNAAIWQILVQKKMFDFVIVFV